MIDESLSGMGPARAFFTDFQIEFVEFISFFHFLVGVLRCLFIPMFKSIVESFTGCATFVWLVRIWFVKSCHKPPDKIQIKRKPILAISLRIILLTSLANPGNSFVVMSNEGVGIQSCDSSFANHAVTSLRGREFLSSINNQSAALDNCHRIRRNFVLGGSSSEFNQTSKNKRQLTFDIGDISLEFIQTSNNKRQLTLDAGGTSSEFIQTRRIKNTNNKPFDLEANNPKPIGGKLFTFNLASKYLVVDKNNPRPIGRDSPDNIDG